MVTQTHHNATLYLHWLYCWNLQVTEALAHWNLIFISISQTQNSWSAVRILRRNQNGLYTASCDRILQVNYHAVDNTDNPRKLASTPGYLYSSFTASHKILLLRWRYSPGWALASFKIRLQASRFLDLSVHSFIPIFLRSVDTSSSHLIFGLPLRLGAYSFPYNIFFGIAVSCIPSMWPSHRIRWHLMNLTMFSPLIIASNSSFRRILHNSFSFTGPYIFRSIFLSNTANALSFSFHKITTSIKFGTAAVREILSPFIFNSYVIYDPQCWNLPTYV